MRHRRGHALRRRYGRAEGGGLLGHKIQDAYHYALMAAGGIVDGVESTFVGRTSGRYSPATYLRMARREAREGGIKLPRAKSMIAEEATQLARLIRTQAANGGIDANTGMPPGAT